METIQGREIGAMEPLMLTRGLPEDYDYRDTGCDLHPACLTCPLPRCRYEMPPGWAKRLIGEASILRLASAGAPTGTIAATTGLSERTVYRAFARYGVSTRHARLTEPQREVTVSAWGKEPAV